MSLSDNQQGGPATIKKSGDKQNPCEARSATRSWLRYRPPLRTPSVVTFSSRLSRYSLDVHKEKIAVALAEEGRTGDVRSYGSIDNTPGALGKLLKKLSAGRQLSCCYEAGGCGYNVYRQILAAGHTCIVAAPSRIPRPAGDRVKTDRRDAVMLAKLHRASMFANVNWHAYSSTDDIESLATSAGVHVSIVAGRWQREHADYRKFSRLIVRNTVRNLIAKELFQ